MIKILRKSIDKFINSSDNYYEKKYQASQWNDVDEIKKEKLFAINDLLLYARDNFPSYNELFKLSNIDLPIKEMSELDQIPSVDKSFIKQLVIEYKNGNFASKSDVWHSTTGSTGMPLKFPCSKESEHIKNGFRRRLYRWYGLEVGDTWVKLWRGDVEQSLKAKVKSFLTGRYTISIYDPNNPLDSALDSVRADFIISQLNKLKPVVIDGFVSALVIISKHIIENNVELSFEPRSIVTGAEKLSDGDRAIISKAFGCKVFNRYGGTEGSIIAHECEHQATSTNFLHVQEERIHLNYELDETSDKHAIILTDLLSRPIPFIKYNIGDLVEKSEAMPCECGRIGLTLIKNVDGRTNDFFYDINRKKITSHIIQNYIKNVDGIIKYQAIQDGDYNLLINIIGREGFDLGNMNTCIQKLEKIFGLNNIDVRLVDSINVGVGGKFRQHICKVKQ
ncbi:hypothetical protein AB6D33_11655 [Vibrio splendidus]